MENDDLMQELERQSRARLATVKSVLHEAGRPDLAIELDANLRDLRLGLTQARAVWHSISPAQRKVITLLSEGRWLVRSPASRTRYDARGEPGAISNVCGIATVRALTAHELLDCDGTTFDPEARLTLSERGRFVVKEAGQPQTTL